MSVRRRDGKAGRSSRLGADEALATLVNQFSDPLVFLRELVQNSLDAGSTRIDVDFTFQAGPEADAGLMTIAVIDNGEGMHERIIDEYLLTLFRSTKENDLTKIGKFGVGFVSIFAIEPDLVVLETGQTGESWRILFHPDKSYEKLRLDEPLEGTSIALHKKVTKSELEDIRIRGRDTVRYWCKYAEAEIHVDGEPVGEPFGLDAALAIAHDEPGTSIALGFAPPRDRDGGNLAALAATHPFTALRPIVGFYNRGLTLVESTAPPDSGAAEAELLAGLSVRVKSRYLEHTLTRDNVRQDESYAKAIKLIERQIETVLRPRLIAHIEALAAHLSPTVAAPDPGGPGLTLALLYARLPSMGLDRRARDAAMVPTLEGPPLRWRDLESAKGPTGAVLYASKSNALTALLARRGVPVVLAHHGLIAYIQLSGYRAQSANTVFQTAMPTPPSDADNGPREQCIARVAELLDRAKTRVRRVVLGDLAYPGSARADALYLRQEEAFGLTRPGHDDRPGLLGGARDLVLNTSHPVIASAMGLAPSNSALAAQLIAQAVCIAEGADAKRTVALARTALAWSPSDAAWIGEDGQS